MRPPDLPGLTRQHRDAALEADDVDVIARNGHGGIDIDQALELGAPARRRDRRLPHQGAIGEAERDDATVVEAADRHVA